MTTKYEYNPEFETIVKYKNNEWAGSLRVAEIELEVFTTFLWNYLKDKKFSLEVETLENSATI